MRAAFFVLLTATSSALAGPVAEQGALALRSVQDARFKFEGAAGERIAANIDGWLLAVPVTNPGMLEMFRLRDRQPSAKLVPWAGEFAGKYLLSCVGALRVSHREDLMERTAAFVSDLIATQAEDGYLGPFPSDRRLAGEWDLWGHYHIMRGLLDWHDLTGDGAAMACARKAADLVCRTYLDGDRRVFDAGSHEMNMAVSHVMAELHRRTGEPRYLELAHNVEKDWERAGDYLRKGVEGVPFYKTPLPRWESLHDLQALVEMWRITGDARYRDAFRSHWQTIRDYDVRNSGAFSGGEQATGNQWAPTAIETCCTVAWMALSIDMLRLDGEAGAADELERATFNGALGAQHPGGHWWTYNTPMDGDRKASAHDIVFQARAGTPELNCCSVNGPRAPGMLAEWAVMRDGAGLVVNTHAPMTFTAGGTVLRCESRYPADGQIKWRVSSGETKLPIRFRIPPWAERATARLNGEPLPVTAGTYCTVDRVWKESDTVEFSFPMTLRSLAGQREMEGRVSVYRGPLLLAWDQKDNTYDEFRIPRLTPEALHTASEVRVPKQTIGGCAPWVLVEVPTSGRTVVLRDFATAGMNGTRYRSWLPAGPPPVNTGEPPVVTALQNSVSLNGQDQLFAQPMPEGWAAGDFTVSMEVNVKSLPEKRTGQVFSAWCAGGDDPLRLIMDNGRLHARIEGGEGAGTSGVSLTPGTWHTVTAVKEGSVLTLFVDGEALVSASAPARLATASRLCALGGNPLYKGEPEFLHADFRKFAFWNRALGDSEVASLKTP